MAAMRLQQVQRIILAKKYLGVGATLNSTLNLLFSLLSLMMP